ncbi:hypothetical protein LEP1GSC098_0468 [Leptospira interrogans serovar Grippotyphosa str. UI 08434]|nr:hypothetical protein LEP1GSC098_0468 [Leptospira interrogans serovar Grippotyphosa str. UI 08434]
MIPNPPPERLLSRSRLLMNRSYSFSVEFPVRKIIWRVD